MLSYSIKKNFYSKSVLVFWLLLIMYLQYMKYWTLNHWTIVWESLAMFLYWPLLSWVLFNKRLKNRENKYKENDKKIMIFYLFIVTILLELFMILIW